MSVRPNVDVRTGVQVTAVAKSDVFEINTSAGVLSADQVIVASGGLSIPKIGASGLAYDIARRFDISLRMLLQRWCRSPLAVRELDWMASLAGVSLEAEASAEGPWGKARFREGLLFTHRGLTGPSVLQVSSYMDGPSPVVIDLIPDAPGASLLLAAKQDRPKQQLGTALAAAMPTRLVDAILPRLAPELSWTSRLADLKNAVLEGLSDKLHHWQVMPSGDESYAKAEVTRGGYPPIC